MSDPEPSLLQWLLVKVVTDTDRPRSDKVHLKNFLFFVEDYIFVIFIREISWHQAERNIIQKFGVLVLLRIEENPKIIENIVE